MPTVSVLFDIPDGYELADEKARIPKSGETFISSSGSVMNLSDGAIASPRVIVRPEWKWPAWIKAPWLAMDVNGTWYGYLTKPFVSSGMWCSAGVYTRICADAFDFTPPPVTDWKQSLRKNPNT